jgi:hypothetical protein
VCVACSQLQKLRAALLDIRQTHVIPGQHWVEEVYQKEGQGTSETTVVLSSQMQKQLNTCIRHHQDIKGYA